MYDIMYQLYSSLILVVNRKNRFFNEFKEIQVPSVRRNNSIFIMLLKINYYDTFYKKKMIIIIF